jgi:hypothetical protein
MNAFTKSENLRQAEQFSRECELDFMNRYRDFVKKHAFKLSAIEIFFAICEQEVARGGEDLRRNSFAERCVRIMYHGARAEHYSYWSRVCKVSAIVVGVALAACAVHQAISRD